MIKFIAFALIAVILISILRMVIGLVGKGLSELVQPSSPGGSGPQRPAPVTGELKQDPVCGTYVATTTDFRKSVDGRTVYFCSAACREKYRG